MKFSDLNLHPDLMEGIDAMGFESPTAVQELAIPELLQGKDMIGCAQTGTGKTAAYLLPTMDHILKDHREGINAIIIAPTRELAKQIDSEIQGFAYFTAISAISVYGGGDSQGWEQQKKALEQGADIVVATPGRLISHLNLGYVNVKDLQVLILDEADRMLDMGFVDDIVKIVEHFPDKRQTLMFSATMPPNIRKLAKSILSDPAEVNIAISKPAENILQAAYLTYEPQKLKLTIHLLKDKLDKRVIIFCSTKVKVKEINRMLKREGVHVTAIHSDLDQSEREQSMQDFANGKVKVLVATDIVSRGIDIEGIDLIINYDVPSDAEDYIHRIGRTARAESSGIGLTFISEDDQWRFSKIEKLIEKSINKIPLPPHIGKGPEWKEQRGRQSRPFYSKGRGGKSRPGSGNRNKRR